MRANQAKYSIGAMARILGVSTRTLQRYEADGRIERARVSKPGAHYFHEDVLKLFAWNCT